MRNMSAISWWEKSNNSKIWLWCLCCTRPTYILILLVHWKNNSALVDMYPYSNTSQFWTNQSLLFLLNAACLTEKQQIPIIKFLVWPDQFCCFCL